MHEMVSAVRLCQRNPAQAAPGMIFSNRSETGARSGFYTCLGAHGDQRINQRPSVGSGSARVCPPRVRGDRNGDLEATQGHCESRLHLREPLIVWSRENCVETEKEWTVSVGHRSDGLLAIINPFRFIACTLQPELWSCSLLQSQHRRVSGLTMCMAESAVMIFFFPRFLQDL